jgi:SAM-dependent methyltransferase
MDYRKATVFGENWSPSRYRVLPYFQAEKEFLLRAGIHRVVELGCGNGWNMSRFAQYGLTVIGLDTVAQRVALARAHGPALLADGLHLPFASDSLDAIYIQHVLHHIGNVRQALDEVWRCLRPGGTLFLIETTEDNPIIRWGRRLYPRWLGDEINASFTFCGLQQQLTGAHFSVRQAGQYSVLFWLWEILPDQLAVMERLTPLAVRVEQWLQSRWQRHSAHCFFVATRLASDR